LVRALSLPWCFLVMLLACSSVGLLAGGAVSMLFFHDHMVTSDVVDIGVIALVCATKGTAGERSRRRRAAHQLGQEQG
jgi:hypothetical protein